MHFIIMSMFTKINFKLVNCPMVLNGGLFKSLFLLLARNVILITDFIMHSNFLLSQHYLFK